MAVITHGEVFTVGSTRSTLQSGHGTALINGVRISLDNIHYPAPDTAISLSSDQVTTTVVATAAPASTSLTAAGFQFDMGTILLGEIAAVPTVGPVTRTAPFPARIRYEELEATGFINLDYSRIDATTTITPAGGGGDTAIGGISLPENTTIEVLPGSIAFVANGGAVDAATSTEGALDTSSDVLVTSGKGNIMIRGTRLPLDEVSYPFTIDSTTEVEVLASSILFTE